MFEGRRCEDCEGADMKTSEMDFLPDVHVLAKTAREAPIIGEELCSTI